MNEIRIRNFHLTPHADNVLAIMDAELPELALVVHHVKVIHGKSGIFCALPTVGGKDGAGKWQFSPALSLGAEAEKEILSAARQAYNQATNKSEQDVADDDLPF